MISPINVKAKEKQQQKKMIVEDGMIESDSCIRARCIAFWIAWEISI